MGIKFQIHKTIFLACGSSHVVALDETGLVFVFGQNDQGQLGLGTAVRDNKFSPMKLTSLTALPVAQIFSGGNHSGVLTVSGAVFVWGRNSWGQLGLGEGRFVNQNYFC